MEIFDAILDDVIERDTKCDRPAGRTHLHILLVSLKKIFFLTKMKKILLDFFRIFDYNV